MTDSEFIFILFSNTVGVISFFIFFASIYYMLEIKRISDPAIKRRRWVIGSLGMLLFIALSAWILTYGNIVAFPMR
ncbi:hypothetical protein ACFL22_00670 [Patescibacteria group bacterium]